MEDGDSCGYLGTIITATYESTRIHLIVLIGTYSYSVPPYYFISLYTVFHRLISYENEYHAYIPGRGLGVRDATAR